MQSTLPFAVAPPMPADDVPHHSTDKSTLQQTAGDVFDALAVDGSIDRPVFTRAEAPLAVLVLNFLFNKACFIT